MRQAAWCEAPGWSRTMSVPVLKVSGGRSWVRQQAPAG